MQTKPTGKLRALGYVGLERSTRRAVLVGPGPVPHRDRLRVRLPQSGFAALDRSLSVLGEAPTSFGRIAAVCAALNVEVNNREHRATKRKSSMIREVERQRLRRVPDTAQTVALGRAGMVSAKTPRARTRLVIQAAAAGTVRTNVKMAEAVGSAKIGGHAQVDPALGRAATYGRFATGGLGPMLSAGGACPPGRRATETSSLAQATAGWGDRAGSGAGSNRVPGRDRDRRIRPASRARGANAAAEDALLSRPRRGAPLVVARGDASEPRG